MQIDITVREVYGTPKAYPANDAARTLAQLANTTTLTRRTLDLAQALGHTIEQTAGPAWVDHIV